MPPRHEFVLRLRIVLTQSGPLNASPLTRSRNPEFLTSRNHRADVVPFFHGERDLCSKNHLHSAKCNYGANPRRLRSINQSCYSPVGIFQTNVDDDHEIMLFHGELPRPSDYDPVSGIGFSRDSPSTTTSRSKGRLELIRIYSRISAIAIVIGRQIVISARFRNSSWIIIEYPR